MKDTNVTDIDEVRKILIQWHGEKFWELVLKEMESMSLYWGKYED